MARLTVVWLFNIEFYVIPFGLFKACLLKLFLYQSRNKSGFCQSSVDNFVSFCYNFSFILLLIGLYKTFCLKQWNTKLMYILILKPCPLKAVDG